VDTQVNVRQKFALAKKANGSLGCIGHSIASRWKEILPLHSVLVRPHLECWVHFWDPQYRRDMDILRESNERPERW